MARVCLISGKKNQVGHKVSHSNRKTKKVFHPNLKKLSVYSQLLETSFRMRISTHALRTIEANGGLDEYLLGTSNSRLSPDAVFIKKMLLKVKSVIAEKEAASNA